MSDIIVGIDLGTTNSCIGIFDQTIGRVVIIPDEKGNKTISSSVLFSKTTNSILVGNEAMRLSETNPENTIVNIKRLIGKYISNRTVKSDINHFSFNVIPDKNDMPNISLIHNNINIVFSPEEISSLILKKLKDMAEDFLSIPIKKAVITVPAYFNNIQRQSTINAGKMIGLDVIRIINEPTSAAIAYGLNKNINSTILIFDLGGGTFDISILNIGDKVFKVIGTIGDSHMGGEDFDNLIVQWCLKKFVKENNISSNNILKLLKNKSCMKRIKIQSEIAKINLSTKLKTKIKIISFFQGYDLCIYLTRNKMEDICKIFIDKCNLLLTNVLKNSKLTKNDIDDVILVGGSTRMPKIKILLKEYFGKIPLCNVNPDEVVAKGASIQAAIKSINLFKHETIKNIVIIDSVPLSFGIKTPGNLMSIIIKKDSLIPCIKSKIFTTHTNNQSVVNICIYQGNEMLVKDNLKLGEFELSGIKPAMKGVPKIEVIFKMDVNGILEVHALNKMTGDISKIIIDNNMK